MSGFFLLILISSLSSYKKSSDSPVKESVFLPPTPAIPNNLPWPVPKRDVRHVSLFFNEEKTLKSIGRKCATPNFGKKNHFYKHLGIDIFAKAGTPVRVIYPGQVIQIFDDGQAGWGKAVVVAHDDNAWTSVYWHLKELRVTEGLRLSRGEQIGSLFDTAHMGDIAHVHLGIRRGPFSTDSLRGYGNCGNLTLGFVNPLDYLQNSEHHLLDDFHTYHTNNWIHSNNNNLYHGIGYHTCDDDWGFARYDVNVSWTGWYSIYARFPPYRDRTNHATFSVFANQTYKFSKTFNQTVMTARGQWQFIGSLFLKKNCHVQVRLDCESDGATISDAILLRKQ